MNDITRDSDLNIPSRYENISLGMLLNEMNISHLANTITSGLMGQSAMNVSELIDNITTSLDAADATAVTNRQPSHRDPLTIVIPVTICYAIIFVAGILGNVITCAVISRNKSMHTATNYYLFNLAVSDLLLLLSGELTRNLLNILLVSFWLFSSYHFHLHHTTHCSSEGNQNGLLCQFIWYETVYAVVKTQFIIRLFPRPSQFFDLSMCCHENGINKKKTKKRH